MTKILTPVATWGSNPTYPEDGVDPETAAGLEVSIQSALNRAEFLSAVQATGVPRVRSVSSIAALKAVTGQTTGDHVVVKDLGFFQFEAAAVLTSDDVNIVTPTVGGGRWLLNTRALRGAINGLASLDATARVPAAQLRGQLVSTGTTGVTSFSGGTASGSESNAIASLFTPSLVVGQVFEVHGSFFCSRTSGTSTDGEVIRFHFDVIKPSAAIRYLQGPSAVLGFSNHRNGISGRFVADETGAHTIRLRVVGSAGGLTYSAISSAQFDSYVVGGV